MTSNEIRAGAEMNHRIANNLALVASIIQTDSRAIRDPDAVFILEMTRRRIHAIARVHRHLYRDDSHASVDLRAFLEELGADLRGVCEDDGGLRHLRVEADSIEMQADLAASLGILVAELVGNACKHAYPAATPGEVRVRLSSPSGDGWTLIVEDDGAQPFRLPQSGGVGLGMRIVEATARRLGAHYRWEPADPGTRFVLIGRHATLIEPAQPMV